MFFVFRDRVSCSLGWPQTQHVAEDDRNPPASTSPVLGPQAWVSCPALCCFNWQIQTALWHSTAYEEQCSCFSWNSSPASQKCTGPRLLPHTMCFHVSTQKLVLDSKKGKLCSLSCSLRKSSTHLKYTSTQFQGILFVTPGTEPRP